MPVYLDMIDSAPIANSEFDAEFLQWLWVLIDSSNENLTDIQNAFNLFSASNYSSSEIMQMETDGKLKDGIILYDTTNNLYVGRQSGVLTKFTTTPYP